MRNRRSKARSEGRRRHARANPLSVVKTPQDCPAATPESSPQQTHPKRTDPGAAASRGSLTGDQELPNPPRRKLPASSTGNDQAAAPQKQPLSVKTWHNLLPLLRGLRDAAQGRDP